MQLLLNDPRETCTRDLVNRLMNEETKKSTDLRTLNIRELSSKY